MSLTPIFHPEEDWLKAMVDKDQGSLVPQNRKEEWYSEIINSMQSGGSSGGGVLVVHMDVESGVLDKTWREIDAADVAVVVFSGSEDGETWHSREFVTNTNTLNGNYFASTVYAGGSSDYMALDSDEYPVRQP
jgi:hypothetical protein